MKKKIISLCGVYVHMVLTNVVYKVAPIILIGKQYPNNLMGCQGPNIEIRYQE